MDYLTDVLHAYKRIDDLALEYKGKKWEAKKYLASLIEKARFEADHSIIDIANYLNITRQAVNQLLVEVYGVRYQDRSEAAKLGHKQTQVNTEIIEGIQNGENRPQSEEGTTSS